MNTQAHFNRKHKFSPDRIISKDKNETNKKITKKKRSTFCRTDVVNFCLFVLYEEINTNRNKIINT